MRDDDRDGLRHVSGHVLCPRRGAVAVINAVERQRGTGSLRSVFWCSLRGESQCCGEDCGAPTVLIAGDVAPAASPAD